MTFPLHPTLSTSPARSPTLLRSTDGAKTGAGRETSSKTPADASSVSSTGYALGELQRLAAHSKSPAAFAAAYGIEVPRKVIHAETRAELGKLGFQPTRKVLPVELRKVLPADVSDNLHLTTVKAFDRISNPGDDRLPKQVLHDFQSVTRQLLEDFDKSAELEPRPPVGTPDYWNRVQRGVWGVHMVGSTLIDVSRMDDSQKQAALDGLEATIIDWFGTPRWDDAVAAMWPAAPDLAKKLSGEWRPMLWLNGDNAATLESCRDGSRSLFPSPVAEPLAAKIKLLLSEGRSIADIRETLRGMFRACVNLSALRHDAAVDRPAQWRSIADRQIDVFLSQVIGQAGSAASLPARR